MKYITAKRNKNRELGPGDIMAFLSQFSPKRTMMMYGHLLFLQHLTERTGRPIHELRRDAIVRASKTCISLAEDTIDNLTEFYAEDRLGPSPTLSAKELFTAGYQSSLEYYKEAANSITKSGSFEGADLMAVTSHLTAIGLELAKNLERIICIPVTDVSELLTEMLRHTPPK